MKPLTSKQWNKLNTWMRNNPEAIASNTPAELTTLVQAQGNRYVTQSHIEHMATLLRIELNTATA